ncbi:hypothetical protein B0H17DRAFT_1060236 [Mycena rosella]|uniref:Transmembrane protein n=1 Tax=Mycena rosella TaxID=1033263 RepID=A0AAD7GJB1_MYCRO|nr:hypothetical protein B0H17DRAFT_1060236 [Mycena rosella]
MPCAASSDAPPSGRWRSFWRMNGECLTKCFKTLATFGESREVCRRMCPIQQSTCVVFFSIAVALLMTCVYNFSTWTRGPTFSPARVPRRPPIAGSSRLPTLRPSPLPGYVANRPLSAPSQQHALGDMGGETGSDTTGGSDVADNAIPCLFIRIPARNGAQIVNNESGSDNGSTATGQTGSTAENPDDDTYRYETEGDEDE